MGSYMYMAPEVFLEGAYSDKSDVYALGCVMYELFARTLRVLYLGSAD